MTEMAFITASTGIAVAISWGVLVLIWAGIGIYDYLAAARQPTQPCHSCRQIIERGGFCKTCKINYGRD